MAENKSWFSNLWDSVTTPQGLTAIAALGGGLYAANQAGKSGGGGGRSTGYQGGIPTLSAVRQQVPTPFDPNRRPGSGGRRYFTDTQFVSPGQTQMGERAMTLEDAASMVKQMKPEQEPDPALVQELLASGQSVPNMVENTVAAQQRAQQQAQLLAQSNAANVQGMAKGGIASLREGRYLRGETDGMADEVPANIEGKQPALLSDGEFVIPADVVSHLGNGNSEAGAKVLQQMLARIRKERTGNPKQGKQINPDSIVPA
jgi:hypothetical protein